MGFLSWVQILCRYFADTLQIISAIDQSIQKYLHDYLYKYDFIGLTIELFLNCPNLICSDIFEMICSFIFQASCCINSYSVAGFDLAGNEEVCVAGEGATSVKFGSLEVTNENRLSLQTFCTLINCF